MASGQTAPQLTRTYDQFLFSAREFLRLSDALRDGWEMRGAELGRDHVVHYLAKRCTIALPLIQASVEDHDEVVEVLSDEEDIGSVEKHQEASPTVAMTPAQTTASNNISSLSRSKTVLMCEYHVIHSTSYQVPVLYFTASYSSGRTVLLSDLWQLLPASSLMEENGKWGMVTDTEHPLLLRPFYHIHPCHTAKVMSTISGCPVTASGCHDNYVLTWLSVFGPLVGLQLSLEYGRRLLSNRMSNLTD